MDITNCYKSEDYGNIFRYFFELYIIAFTMGVATDEFEESRKNLPNINIDSESEVKSFLLECTSYLQEGYTPSLLSLFMERQYWECIKPNTSKEQQHMMDLAQRLIVGIHQFDITVILDMARLWDTNIRIYAETSFYPRLPKDIQEKYFLL